MRGYSWWPIAASAADDITVYHGVLYACSDPTILHWLGVLFRVAAAAIGEDDDQLAREFDLQNRLAVGNSARPGEWETVVQPRALRPYRFLTSSL